MYRTNDPEADLKRWLEDETEKEMKYLAKLPKCSECKEPIQQDDAVCLNGKWYCDECLDDMREDIEV